jgi:CDP-diacylglycerol--serine O-phosphatidyltransferase
VKHKRSRKVRQRLRHGAYLLPSLFTTGNLLLGFYAVVKGWRGDFKTAALLVFLAAILDTLDGRIARLMGTESDFGRELDSLADLFTFGATPALLAFFWGLSDFGRAGWLIPLFYLVCMAIRLARFNVQSRVVDSRWFVGLPAPAAAGAVCSFLFFAPDREWMPWLAGALAIALLGIGVLMVSTFRYSSFKKIDLRRRWSYRALLPVAALLLVIAYHPPAFFLTVAVFYTLSGPVTWFFGRLSWRRKSEPEANAEDIGEQPGAS